MNLVYKFILSLRYCNLNPTESLNFIAYLFLLSNKELILWIFIVFFKNLPTSKIPLFLLFFITAINSGLVNKVYQQRYTQKWLCYSNKFLWHGQSPFVPIQTTTISVEISLIFLSSLLFSCHHSNFVTVTLQSCNFKRIKFVVLKIEISTEYFYFYFFSLKYGGKSLGYRKIYKVLRSSASRNRPTSAHPLTTLQVCNSRVSIGSHVRYPHSFPTNRSAVVWLSPCKFK